jgi:predicted RNA-binding protein YlqC (UPF0109 family)
VYLYIPNVAVGAIIGKKGTFIKNIIKVSRATLKITPLTPEETKTAVERQVCITGTPESQWKAQYYIYEKIRQERYASDENVKLRVEIEVPAHIVGRIIGKSGRNVRELQRITGASIKLPDDSSTYSSSTVPSSGDSTGKTGAGGDGEQKGENSTSSSSTNDNNASDNQNLDQNTTKNEEQSKEQHGENKQVKEDEVKTTPTGAADEESDKTDEKTTTEESSKSESVKDSDSNNNKEPSATAKATTTQGVIIRITGNFVASQNAQRRIQSLVQHSIHGNNSNSNVLSSMIQMPQSMVPLGMDNMHSQHPHMHPNATGRVGGNSSGVAGTGPAGQHSQPLLLSNYPSTGYSFPNHMSQPHYPQMNRDFTQQHYNPRQNQQHQQQQQNGGQYNNSYKKNYRHNAPANSQQTNNKNNDATKETTAPTTTTTTDGSLTNENGSPNNNSSSSTDQMTNELKEININSTTTTTPAAATAGSSTAPIPAQ